MGVLNALRAGVAGFAGGVLQVKEETAKRQADIDLARERARIELGKEETILSMREKIAIAAEERARAPLDRAGAFLRERVPASTTPVAAAPVESIGKTGIHAEGDKTVVNLGAGHNYADLLAKVNSLPDGEEKTAFLAQIKAGMASDQAAADKVATSTARRQELQAAQDAMKIADPQAFGAYSDATKGGVHQLGPDSVLTDSSGQVLYGNDAGDRRRKSQNDVAIEVANIRANAAAKRQDEKIKADAAKIEQKFKLKEKDSPELTPDAIKAAAARYLVDGTMPSLGFGHRGATNRALVLNGAAEMSKARGDSPTEQRVSQLSNVANKSALQQLVKSEAMVGAFEENFRSNVDIAKEYIAKVGNTDMPLLNKGVQYIERKFTDDPALGGLDIALKTVVNEYAKIVSGSMGNTATAEGEFKKITALLAAADTMGKALEVISVMERETENRMKGFQTQKDRIIDAMTGAPPREKKHEKAAATPAPASAAPIKPARPSLDDIFG